MDSVDNGTNVRPLQALSIKIAQRQTLISTILITIYVMQTINNRKSLYIKTEDLIHLLAEYGRTKPVRVPFRIEDIGRNSNNYHSAL